MGGAWLFLLGGLICWVDSFNEGDFSLLNSVKNDSSLVTSQRDTVCLMYAFSASWQVIQHIQLHF